MAAGYTVGIASETKAFKQGVEVGVIKPLEEAQDAADALGKSRGPEQLERDLKAAQKATEKLEDETKDTARAIEQEYRDSYRKLKDSSDDAFDRAKEGASEFKDEANSTAREAAASFDGSAESIGDAFQEVAANAFAGFGPAGALAGIAAAAGLGTALSAITAQQEAADELKEKMLDAYRSAAEEGRAWLDDATIQASALDIVFGDNMESIRRQAERAGIDIETMVLALAGDQDALATAYQIAVDKQHELREAAAEQLGTTGSSLDGIVTKVDDVVSSLDTQKKLHEEAAAAARLGLDVQDELAEKESANNRRARDALDERGRKLQEFYSQARNTPSPVITPQVDLGPAQWAIDRFTAGGKRLTIVADVVDRAGRRID